jgi:hypothetical protein
VTAASCDGLACDRIGGGDVYECVASSVLCYASPSVVWCDEGTDFVGLCEACANDTGTGPYCGPTMGCLTTGLCARYCCDDGDCGSGRCDKDGVPGGVGVCLD